MVTEITASEVKAAESDIMSEKVNRSVFEMFREMSAGKKPVFLEDEAASSALDDLQARLDQIKANFQKPASRRS